MNQTTPSRPADRPLKAELDWLIDSPVLLTPAAHPTILPAPLPHLTAGLKQHLRSSLHRQKVLEECQEALAQRLSLRLGIRYESLWQSITRQIPDCDVLATNVQVQENHRTLGEFDLLYKAGQHTIHQELAIKFYLGTPGSRGDWCEWIGPDKADQLARKLRLMFDHQITLSDTEAGKNTLLALTGTPQHWQKEILLQGYLFYPWRQPCASPFGANTQHLRGDWLPLQQLEEYLMPFASDVFMVPQRQHWLALRHWHQSEKSFDKVALLQYLLERFAEKERAEARPVLIVSGQAGSVPFFVTPDNWF